MLKVLPENIYSLIAAGEVIQRPASVVKELMENSADAGASSITLIINDYGRTLIQVIDNGCGMDANEAQICFLSHATSKIDSVDDLQNLSTFGFRGEALASIAACADVILKTKKEGQQTGTQVHITGSQIVEQSEISCPQGCNIAVRNLFYNIPARRKFLKSDSSEYRAIVSEFIRVALTRLDIEFRLVSNSKEAMVLPGGHNLKQRISDICGGSIIKQLIDIKVDTTVVKIHGVIGTPQSAKKSQPNTFLFANARFFRSPILHKAVVKGFGSLIPDGFTPPYFLFLEVAPQEMDVNISPSKTEIKLENEQIIFQILEAAVKEAIGMNAFAPAIDFDTEDVPTEITTRDGFTLTKEQKDRAIRGGGFKAPKFSNNPLFNPFDSHTIPSKINAPESGEKSAYPIDNNNFAENSLLEEPQMLSVAQIDKHNVVVTDLSGDIMIVNIPRARQRIFYDNYLNSIKKRECAIQQELFPKTISLDHATFTTLIANLDKVERLGFEVREFGKDCVVVSGVPADFRGGLFSVEECIEEIAHLIEEKNEEEFLHKAAMEVVRHTNFSYSERITESEAKAVINRLLCCSDSATAPTGGYCIVKIGAQEIAKRLM